jgi:hypothetical protein
MSNLETWAGLEQAVWAPVLNHDIHLGSYYKIVPTEGYLAWEYNPLRNYRLSENMYEKDGKYYTWQETKNLLTSQGYIFDDTINKFKYIETLADKSTQEKIIDLPDNWTLREAGELVDFITNELSFNLEHPVDILP